MKYIVVIAGIVGIALIAFGLWKTNEKDNESPATVTTPTQQALPDSEQADEEPAVEVIAENLEIPWEIAWLPDGSILVTERPGRLLKIGTDRTVIPIQGVRHVGEGGLLGMALHPSFAENQQIYLYLTTQSGSGLTNRVERYRLNGNALQDRTVILEGIPGAQIHDGGRIAFGPDGMLYVTTGDAGNSALAQDPSSLAGKILRISDDGSAEPYSLGHRNPQGITWDSRGRMWATEHGRSGVLSGFDELNLIEKGKNYGWPEIQGDETRTELNAPVAHSGARDTWAPASAEFFNQSIFFGGLRGEALYEADVSNPAAVSIQEHFKNQHGRIRTVRVGPDGFLYLLTSNRDGRGKVNAGDDKIIRVNPASAF